MARRRVRRSAAFLEEAKRLFPVSGSATGRPSFKLFQDGPLRGAETAFALDFEAQAQHIEGIGSIRYVITAPTPFFSPLVISAMLRHDGDVEIVGVIEHPGYWDLIRGDPPE